MSHSFLREPPPLPVQSSHPRLKQIVAEKFSEVKKRKKLGSYKEESNHLKAMLDAIFPHDTRYYETQEGRLGFCKPAIAPFANELFHLYHRTVTAKHMALFCPSEEAVRYAVHNNKPKLLERQLSIGYGLNACIHPYTFDRRTDTSRFTYPLIEGISFFEIVKTLAVRKGININVRNSDGVSAVEMGIRRLSTALRSTAASSTWKTDGEKRDLPLILHVLLAMGAKRPTGPLANETCYKKIVRKLVRERWGMVRKLAYRVCYAADAFNKLLVHVRFKPGGDHWKAAQEEYQSAHRIQVEQKRAEEEEAMRGKGAVDPASYWDDEEEDTSVGNESE